MLDTTTTNAISQHSESRDWGARLLSTKVLFLAVVVAPTIIAALYFFLIASDVFTSESRFMVRAPGRPVPTGIASLLMGGDSSGGSDVSAVREYSTSRDALKQLDKTGKIREIYNRPEINFLSRLDGFGKTTFEDTYNYFGKKISIETVNKSSVTILRVQAFRAEDAKWVNEQLLRQSELLVNRLNERSRYDTVRNAEQDVVKARDRSQQAALALAAFRNRYGIIDPDKQSMVSLQMIAKLQDEIISNKTMLAQTLKLAPINPQIEAYRSRIATLEAEVVNQSKILTGGQSSLAGKNTEYARLMLETQFADRLLTAAMASLENAHNEFRRQQVYIERVSQPDAPDEATRPRRVRSVAAVLLTTTVAWGIIVMLLAALREHQM